MSESQNKANNIGSSCASAVSAFILIETYMTIEIAVLQKTDESEPN